MSYLNRHLINHFMLKDSILHAGCRTLISLSSFCLPWRVVSLCRVWGRVVSLCRAGVGTCSHTWVWPALPFLTVRVASPHLRWPSRGSLSSFWCLELSIFPQAVKKLLPACPHLLLLSPFIIMSSVWAQGRSVWLSTDFVLAFGVEGAATMLTDS